MRFSIIIPLYNKRDFVERTLANALDQTFRDFEVVVVDDGSTDGSADVVRACNDPRVRLIAQENAGAYAARNTAMENARGEWLAFLDADDVWFPNHLAELARVADEVPEAGILSTRYTPAVSANIPQRVQSPPPSRRAVSYFAVRASGANAFWTGCLALRRDAFETLGGMKPLRKGQDSEFWTRVALHYPAAASNQITSVYVVGTGGISESYSTVKKHSDCIDDVRELSPTVRLVIEHLPVVIEPEKRKELVDFVDSRVYLGMQIAALQREHERFQSLERLLSRPDWRRVTMYRAVMRCPRPILRRLVSPATAVQLLD